MGVSKLTLVVALVLLGGIEPIHAQGRPTSYFPLAPPPSECIVTPVSEEFLPDALASPATPLATPSEPTSAHSLFPNSGSVDPQTFSEIEALERQVAACWNGGDWRRLAALFTQSYFERVLAATDEPQTDWFPPETVPLDPIDWIPVVVRDLRQVDDGRLAAVVDFCDFEQVHYLREEPAGWRIDDIVDIDRQEYRNCVQPPRPVTPVP